MIWTQWCLPLPPTFSALKELSQMSILPCCFHNFKLCTPHGKCSLLPNPPLPFLKQLLILQVLAKILPSFLILESFHCPYSHCILDIHPLYINNGHIYCILFSILYLSTCDMSFSWTYLETPPSLSSLCFSLASVIPILHWPKILLENFPRLLR